MSGDDDAPTRSVLRRLWWLWVPVGILLLGVLGYASTRSTLLDVDRIEVEGAGIRVTEWTVRKVAAINKFNVEQYAYMVKKMHALKEGDGTLLDNCIMMWGSGLEDGNRHQRKNLPFILAKNEPTMGGINRAVTLYH